MGKTLVDTFRTVLVWDENQKDFIAVADNHMSNEHPSLSDIELAELFSKTFNTTVTVETKRQTTCHN